jgi:8-oxo-dGTP pyrophosphatase MutT (NUDIX family)
MIEKKVTRVLLYTPEYKVLIGKRAEGSTGGGEYALIGGKVDKGETVLEAAIREAKEEIGLLPKLKLWLEHTNESVGSEVLWVCSYFYGLLEGSPVHNHEHTELLLVGEEDLDKLKIAFDHGTRLRDFFAFLHSQN